MMLKIGGGRSSTRLLKDREDRVSSARRWRRAGRGRVGTSGTAALAHVAVYDNYCLRMISLFTCEWDGRVGRNEAFLIREMLPDSLLLLLSISRRHHNTSPTISGCASSTPSVYVII